MGREAEVDNESRTERRRAKKWKAKPSRESMESDLPTITVYQI